MYRTFSLADMSIPTIFPHRYIYPDCVPSYASSRISIAPCAAEDTCIAYFFKYPVTSDLYGAKFAFLRSISSSESFTFKERFGISISMISPSSTMAIVPPDAASGDT